MASFTTDWLLQLHLGNNYTIGTLGRISYGTRNVRKVLYLGSTYYNHVNQLLRGEGTVLVPSASS